MENFARHLSPPPAAAGNFGAVLLRAITQDGSLHVTKPIFKFLNDSRDAMDLRSAVMTLRPALIADITHFLCISHGKHPGIIDHAATKIVDDAARDWLLSAIKAFAAERHYLNRLIVAAGPIARQSGQEKITAIIAGQSKSFEMLATSDRQGCAAGTAIAFAIDWQHTRPLMDQCALALGIEPFELELPPLSQTVALAEQLASTAAKQRAMMFGAQQLLAQQRGLWQLIAGRHTEMQHFGV